MASSNDTLVDDSEAQSVNGADSSATESGVKANLFCVVLRHQSQRERVVGLVVLEKHLACVM